MTEEEKTEEFEIRLQMGNRTDTDPPYVLCTCGWTSESSKNIYRLGVKAVEHEKATGHKRRKHELKYKTAY